MKLGRSLVKVYGCIFVFFNSREIYIEDVGLLKTDAFIQALRRFISVRGSLRKYGRTMGRILRVLRRNLDVQFEIWMMVQSRENCTDMRQTGTGALFPSGIFNLRQQATCRASGRGSLEA